MHLFEELIGTKVAVIGDIMLDRYIYGNVHRISPEAPVPVVIVDRETEALGGSGNVIANLVSFGADVIPVARIGNDLAGRSVLNLLEEKRCLTECIYQSNFGTTTIKTRIVAGNQQVARVDWDSDGISQSESDILKGYIRSALNNTDIVIISDYGKGLCTEELVQNVLSVAKDEFPVFVDPKGNNYTKYSGANCITPNAKEAQEIIPFELDNDHQFVNGADYIREKFNIDVCIITRGKDGMVVSDGKEVSILTTVAQEVYDVSGAGDTVIATLAVCVASGMNFKQAAEIANMAAGIVVSRVGTAPIDINMLRKKLSKDKTIN